ncbi:MAG TPA: hypothetical protein VFR03_03660, partial [Thermoanaerobaculia bacterium]|nr:hypothetical protein [Thermoanaerobaculia bacterium]
MRPRPLPLVCLALLLLALAWGLAGRRGPLPAGDEATPVMMVQSLWLDHDLTWRQADLDRAQALWEGGPAGLTLFTNDGGKTLRYGRPLAYPLAALPFYAVFGVRGIALLNMALFLAMAIAALWLLSDEAGAPLFLAGFFFASAALAYAFRLEPDVFLMACVFFPLLAWRRLERQNLALFAGAGLLLGAAVTASPLLGLLGLPILIDLAARRRWRGLAALVAGIVLAAGLLALIQRVGTGEWSAFGGAQRRTFNTEFPLESPRDLWQGYRAEDASPGIAAGPRLLPRNLLYLLAGRFTGLLPYFPFAFFALILYLLGRKDRSRNLLAAALLLYAGLVLVLHPHDFAGDPGFLGGRPLALVYPAFLFLPERLRARRSLIFPYLAAGLWTAVALLQAPLHTGASTFQRLPLELTLIPGGHLPGYTAQTWGDAVWIVPRDAFFVEERHPHGVWVRGGTRSEVVVVSPKPLSRLAFTVYSLSAANVLTLDSNTGRLTVRFDTEGKRDGTPVDLALSPVAHDLGFFPTGHDLFYR